MPPKGYQSLGEDLITVATRLPSPCSRRWTRDIRGAPYPRPPGHASTVRMRSVTWCIEACGPPAQAGDGPRVDGLGQHGPSSARAESRLPSALAPPPRGRVNEGRSRCLTPQVIEAAATAPVPELANSIDLGSPDFDESKFALSQKLCKRGHEYKQTGRTLLRLPGRFCPQCANTKQREKRARKRKGKTAR